MNKFFNMILYHQAIIDKYKREMNDIAEKINELEQESLIVQNELKLENNKLDILTYKNKIENSESLVNLLAILIFALSIVGSVVFIFDGNSFIDIIYRLLRGILTIIPIIGAYFIVYKIATILIKNHFAGLEEKNKKEIEAQRKKVEPLKEKNVFLSKERSVLVGKYRELQVNIEKEKEIILKINGVLIEELAPLLDDLIEREMNDNQNVKQAMENVSRKLKHE